MNSSGEMLEEYNFDPWGRRRNAADWSYSNISDPYYTQRGFTGHEHLDMFNLIHMNGRIYDPEISRFLSPDPFIQDPYNLLNYNRYTYCLNNPLKYTDPSGYQTAPPEDPLIYNNPGWFKYAPYKNSYQRHTNLVEKGSSIGSAWVNTYLDVIPMGLLISPSEFSHAYNSIYTHNFNGNLKFTFTIDFFAAYSLDGGKTFINTGNYLYSDIIIKNITIEPTGGGGAPGWASDVNTGVNAFMVGNGAKTELLDYAVRTNYQSARTASQFNKLRPTQQAWRTTNTLGKTGAQYLKYAKGLGYVGAGLTTTYSAYNAGSYYYNGGTDWQVGAKATLDVIMTGVGFLGPIGFGISATYFIVDAAGGFGDFGEIKP